MTGMLYTTKESLLVTRTGNQEELKMLRHPAHLPTELHLHICTSKMFASHRRMNGRVLRSRVVVFRARDSLLHTPWNATISHTVLLRRLYKAMLRVVCRKAGPRLNTPCNGRYNRCWLRALLKANALGTLPYFYIWVRNLQIMRKFRPNVSNECYLHWDCLEP